MIIISPPNEPGKVWISLECDQPRCNNKHQMIYNCDVFPHEINRQAKIMGWAIVGHGVFCPAHCNSSVVIGENGKPVAREGTVALINESTPGGRYKFDYKLGAVRDMGVIDHLMAPLCPVCGMPSNTRSSCVNFDFHDRPQLVPPTPPAIE